MTDDANESKSRSPTFSLDAITAKVGVEFASQLSIATKVRNRSKTKNVYLTDAESRLVRRQFGSLQLDRFNAFATNLRLFTEQLSSLNLSMDEVLSRVVRTFDVYTKRISNSVVLNSKNESSFVVPTGMNRLQHRTYGLTIEGFNFLYIFHRKRYKYGSIAEFVDAKVFSMSASDVRRMTLTAPESRKMGYDPHVTSVIRSIACRIAASKGSDDFLPIVLTSQHDRLLTILDRRRLPSVTAWTKDADAYSYSFKQSTTFGMSCPVCGNRLIKDSTGVAYDCHDCDFRRWRFGALIRPYGRTYSRLATGCQYFAHSQGKYMLAAILQMREDPSFTSTCRYVRPNLFLPDVTPTSSPDYDYAFSSVSDIRKYKTQLDAESARKAKDDFKRHVDALTTRNLTAMILYGVLSLVPRCLEFAVPVARTDSTIESLMRFISLDVMLPSDRAKIRIPLELKQYCNAVRAMANGGRLPLERELGLQVGPDLKRNETDVKIYNVIDRSRARLLSATIRCEECTSKAVGDCALCEKKREEISTQLSAHRLAFITEGVGNGKVVPQCDYMTADLPGTLSRLMACVMASCPEYVHIKDVAGRLDCLAVSSMQTLYAVIGFDEANRLQGIMATVPTFGSALQGLSYLPAKTWLVGDATCELRGGFSDKQTSTNEMAMCHAFASDHYGNDVYLDKTVREYVTLDGDYPEGLQMFSRVLAYVSQFEKSPIAPDGSFLTPSQMKGDVDMLRLLSRNERSLVRLKELSTYLFRSVIVGNPVFRGEDRLERSTSAEATRVAMGIVNVSKEFIATLQRETNHELAPLHHMNSTFDERLVANMYDQNPLISMAKDTSSGGDLKVKLSFDTDEKGRVDVGARPVRNLTVASAKKRAVIPLLQPYIIANLPFDGEKTKADLSGNSVAQVRTEHQIEHNLLVLELLLDALSKPSTTGLRWDTHARARVFYIMGLLLQAIARDIAVSMKLSQKQDPDERFANQHSRTPDGQLIRIQMGLAEGLTADPDMIVTGAQNEFSGFDKQTRAGMVAIYNFLHAHASPLITPEALGLETDVSTSSAEYKTALAADKVACLWYTRLQFYKVLSTTGLPFAIVMDGTSLPKGKTNVEVTRFSGNPSGLEGTTENNTRFQKALDDFEEMKMTSFWNRYKTDLSVRRSYLEKYITLPPIAGYDFSFDFKTSQMKSQFYGDDGTKGINMHSPTFICKHSGPRPTWWIDLNNHAESINDPSDIMGIANVYFRNLFPTCPGCIARTKAGIVMLGFRQAVIAEGGQISPIADIPIGNSMAFLSRRTEGVIASIRGRPMSSENATTKSTQEQAQELRSMSLAGVRTEWRLSIVLGLALQRSKSTFGNEAQPTLATLYQPVGLGTLTTDNCYYAESISPIGVTSPSPLTPGLNPSLQPEDGAPILSARRVDERVEKQLASAMNGFTLRGPLISLVKVPPVPGTSKPDATELLDADDKRVGLTFTKAQALRLLRGQTAVQGDQLKLPSSALSEFDIANAPPAVVDDRTLTDKGKREFEVGSLRMDLARERTMLASLAQTARANHIVGSQLREADIKDVGMSSYVRQGPVLNIGGKSYTFAFGRVGLGLSKGEIVIYPDYRSLDLKIVKGSLRAFSLAGRPALVIIRALFNISIVPIRAIQGNLLSGTSHHGFNPPTSSDIIRYLERNKRNPYLNRALSTMGLSSSEITAINQKKEGAIFAEKVGDKTYSSSISDMLKVSVPADIQYYYKHSVSTAPTEVYGATGSDTNIIKDSITRSLDNVLCNQIQILLLALESKIGSDALWDHIYTSENFLLTRMPYLKSAI